MGAAPKNWGLSQPPGAETAPRPRGLGEPPAPTTGESGAGGQPPGAGGQTPGAGKLIAAPGEWRQPERLGVGGKITLEETVFGIMKRNSF